MEKDFGTKVLITDLAADKYLEQSRWQRQNESEPVHRENA